MDYKFIRSEISIGALHEQIAAVFGDNFAHLTHTGDRLDVVFFKPLAQADHERLILLVAEHKPGDRSRFDQMRDLVIERANSAVDAPAASLSQAQESALLVLLLFQHGAIGVDGRIKSLRDWR